LYGNVREFGDAGGSLGLFSSLTVAKLMLQQIVQQDAGPAEENVTGRSPLSLGWSPTGHTSVRRGSRGWTRRSATAAGAGDAKRIQLHALMANVR